MWLHTESCDRVNSRLPVPECHSTCSIVCVVCMRRERVNQSINGRKRERKLYYALVDTFPSRCFPPWVFVSLCEHPSLHKRANIKRTTVYFFYTIPLHLNLYCGVLFKSKQVEQFKEDSDFRRANYAAASWATVEQLLRTFRNRTKATCH
jgi:hypothetical protein